MSLLECCQPALGIGRIVEKAYVRVVSVFIDQLTEPLAVIGRINNNNGKSTMIIYDFLKRFSCYSRAEIEKRRR